ncbi:mediator of RNA polymerase II transcription subunit 33A-like [Diospyros lotus]|uniref:mediator of RNA polymerase II transcription subunit 33A-like n=1 Tax=Diospyros lotus TaxID=55363 RepID=UPI002258B000|nr:mediator of RNA polymerase II transcription subunit 33A-like [Diospyros lotus]
MAAAASAEQQQGALWDGVIELTKAAQERGTEPLMWAIQLSSSLNAAGVVLPSPELAKLLVSHVCWSNNVPIAWKFLEKALMMKIVPPILVLALLSASVIPSRRFYPAAYRIYLELLKRHAFSFASQINSPNYKKIMKSIDEVLHISQIFALPSSEPGLLMVGFVFSIVWHLLDASLDDEGLLELTPEKKSRWPTGTQDVEIDSHGSIDEKRKERHEAMLKINTIMAVEIIGELFKNKVTSKILCLARRNLSLHWGCFIQHLRLLAANSSALRNSKNISPEALLRLTSDMRNVLSRECKTSLQKRFHSIIASGSLTSSGQVHGTSRSALWLPFDLFLEDSMDGSQVDATSAVEVLTGLLKSLQAVNQATWQDTFLGLWIAALRVVQRERDPGDGPIPRLDTCMCLLLSVTTLAILNAIEEEETVLKDGAQYTSTYQMKEKLVPGKCRRDLVASLQQLGDYEALLAPPLSITSIVNQAAAKAMLFLSGITVGSGCLDGISLNDMPVNCSGNLRHLIVEACIARNLLDTSAYFWPDYVKGHSSQIPRSISGQMLGWSSLMKGSSLTPPMVNTLVSTPASSLAEIEKVYEIAVSGSDDEKISAATILCGASLVRGWNIQEHTALLITRLLSPPVPADCSGSESHLIGFAPFLNVVLVGISLVDCVHIFSLHGMVPQLAGALMPICEVFGSRAPMVSWTLTTGEKISSHAVFSNAFTLLLKLWRFDRPPLEHVMGDVTPVGSQMTPEYLLLVRNNELASYAKIPRDQHKIKRLSKFSSPASTEPIFMDSFPRLKSWYRQNQECIASTLSGLINGSPVHQIVDGLLNMMFRKVNRGGQPTTSGSSNSSGSAMEDNSLQLKLPAWDILEAVPFVLDAALTACAHGRLSPRELATGLKDLADFLPASLATIISYFSAEVTRGIWKAVPMNGTDWPSPAANLATVEQQIKKILAVTGVDVPSLAAAGGSSPATLPLPLAALVSFTITYKFDRAAESLLYLIGPALITLAAGCPWPCLPIIASLWAQKVKRWSDFLIFNASRSVFHHNSDAVDQLLRICFRSTLGLSSSPISSNGGVGALLGHGFRSHLSGRISPVAPGILYLRVHRSVRNVMFMTEVIVVLLMHSVKDIASCGVQTEKMDQLKKTKHGMRYGQLSLAAAMTRVKAAASLGASLVWITGGISLVQSLIKETLPSWFLSDHKSELDAGESEGAVAMLRGYALAYFAVISGTFAWGVDYSSPASIRRRNILGSHLEFLASALDGKISLGCDHATWRAYVSGFVSLMIGCTPLWMQEMDVGVLKRVSNGLRQWNEDELALALLGISGVGAMGAAAEMIMDGEF